MNILGGGMQIAGALLGGSNANKRAKKLEAIANTPGVDIGKAYTDTTVAGQAALPGAQDFASGLNAGALADLDSILNEAIPGYSGMQTQRAGVVGSQLKGEIPDDVSKAVFRRGAAKSAAGGYAGSEFGRNLVSRDLGLTSMDIIGQGMAGMESIIGSTPLPRMTQASDILNVSGRDATNLRSGERSTRLSMLTNAANAPRSGDVLAKGLTDLGGSMGGLSDIVGLLGKI